MTLDTRTIPEFDMFSNIVCYYPSADADSIERGMVWYEQARDFALSLDTNVERAAGIIAALSPMSGWNNNKAKAARLYANNGKVVFGADNSNGYGLSKNVAKAKAIFDGADPLDVIVADKTRAFYLTIVNPTIDNKVVIDRHAFDIAVGMPTDDKTRSALKRKGEYDRFASAYRQAAVTLSLAPAQLQAITWVQWRKDIGKEWAG